MLNLHLFFSKKIRSRFRFIFKGYKILKKNDQVNLLLKLNDVLSRTKLLNVHLSKNLNTKYLDFELSYRQYLYNHILGAPFNKAILYSIGSGKPLSYPLPKEWREKLENENIEIDNFSCSCFWISRTLFGWGAGFFKGLIGIIYLYKRS